MGEGRRRHLWVWAVMGLVLAVALVAGRNDPGQPSDEQRAAAIADEIRCPTCRGLSAADSDAPAAEAIRDDVLRRVQAGQTADEIRDFLVSRYGVEILLKPRSSGVAGLVWILPVIALAGVVVGLVVALRRRRARPGVAMTAADEALVEEALRSSGAAASHHRPDGEDTADRDAVEGVGR